MNVDALFPEREPAQLVLVDDHHPFRAGLRDMLADVAGLEIIGEAADGREGVELCRRTQPDLVLMDLRMPRMDGLAATRAIKEECSRTIVLVMTMHENPDYLLQALRAGAAGYILKDASYEDVVSAIREVLSGESPLDPKLASQLLRRLALEEAQEEPAETLVESERAELLRSLTPRELQVLGLLAKGKTNREIAEDFSISRGTVKNHVEHLMTKLGVTDRTQAAVRALELGIISFPKL